MPDLESDFRRQFGGLPTAARIGAAEETVRRLLVDQGFIDAQVSSSTITTHNPDRATLVFAVTPGELARVGQRRGAAHGFLAHHARGHPRAVRRRRSAGRTGVARCRRRWSASRTTCVSRATTRPSRRPPTSGRVGRDDLNVTLVVDSGRRVDVRFEGDSLPSSVGRVEDLVPVKRLGSVDLSLLEDAQRNVEARLRNAGYKDAKVTFARSRMAPPARA